MSEQNERDNHFAGFAKLLNDELLEDEANRALRGRVVPYDEIHQAIALAREERERFIARRAYDLVLISIKEASANDLEYVSAQEKMQYIPDMTAWPEESE